MKQNKRKIKAIHKIAVVLAAAALLTTTGSAVYVKATDKVETSKTYKTAAETADTDKSAYKDETVYVIAGTNGSVKKIIVSDWLKNTLKTSSIKDSTEVKDAANVKGNETYSMSGNNMRVWDAEGNDIYYQGTIEKELPVNISVSYKLDGKDVSASDLAGKSGKVTMRFDYTNNQYKMVTIDGKSTKIYVPFVMVTGMILDNKNFSNVKVSNGKVINDGSHSVVMGFALPGMQENLDISTDKIKIPDYVEITADVTDFSLTTTLTLASNDIFNTVDMSKVNDIDKLESSLKTMSDSSKKLVDGSSTLYGGLNTLLSKSDELIAGIDKLAAGAKKLKTGTASLSDGASSVNKGMQDLSDGLKQLNSNNDQLNTGAKTVFETLLSEADKQLAAAGLTLPALTIDNYATVLNGAIQSLSDDNVRALATQKAKKAVTDQVTSGVKAAVLQQVLASQNLTQEQYGALPDAVKAQIDAAVDAQMASAAVKAKIDALVSQNMQSTAVTTQIEQAVTQAQEGRKNITVLKTQLDSYNDFYKGLQSYTAGVSDAYSGSVKLKSGTQQLETGASSAASGSKEMSDGLAALQSGSAALKSGVSQLDKGAMQLSAGMKEFNDNGIQKIVDLYNNNVKVLITRLKATVDVSKNYRNFAGISDDTDGSVKFIYRTDSIEK